MHYHETARGSVLTARQPVNIVKGSVRIAEKTKAVLRRQTMQNKEYSKAA